MSKLLQLAHELNVKIVSQSAPDAQPVDVLKIHCFSKYSAQTTGKNLAQI